MPKPVLTNSVMVPTYLCFAFVEDLTSCPSARNQRRLPEGGVRPPAPVSGSARGLLWPMDCEQTWAKLHPRGRFQAHRLVQPLIFLCLWKERHFPNKDGSFHLEPGWEGRHRAEPQHMWSEMEMLFVGNWWDFKIVCFHRKADNHTSQRYCLESLPAHTHTLSLSLSHTHTHTHTLPPRLSQDLHFADPHIYRAS